MMRSVLVASFAFLCLVPYPSVLVIGGEVGVTASALVAVAVLAVNFARLVGQRLLLVAVSLVLTLGVSAYVNGVILGVSSVERSTAVVLTLCLSLLPMLAMLCVYSEKTRRAILLGVCFAIALHIIVAVVQIQAFGNNRFPFLDLYVNPSYADIRAGSEEYALYVKRPFGVFPEPSAMAAVLGPFAILLMQVRRDVSGLSASLMLFAALGGATLIVLSQSVYTLMFIPLFLLASFPSIVQRFGRWPSALVVMLVAVLGIAVRVSGPQSLIAENESLRYRFGSLVAGLRLWVESLGSMMLGSGPGSTVERLAEGGYPFNAVHSVALTFLVELGILVVIPIVALLFALRECARVHFYSVLAWAFAVTFTTGYSALAGLWVFLALVIGEGVRERAHCPLHTNINDRGRGTHLV